MNSEITFDELDTKCFSELPLLLDVIEGSGNRIAAFLNDYLRDLQSFVEGEIRPKRGWKIDEVQDREFSILTEASHRKRIERLENYLCISCGIQLVKSIGNSIKNRLKIDLGHYCDCRGAENWNVLYLGCYREQNDVKNHGILHEYEFYKQRSPENKLIKTYIEHPLQEHSAEMYELNIEKLDIGIFDSAYVFFKERFLPDYFAVL